MTRKLANFGKANNNATIVFERRPDPVFSTGQPIQGYHALGSREAQWGSKVPKGSEDWI